MTCRCGKVQMEFTDSRPRVSTECCCNHCFARVRYLEEVGGPPVPSKPLLNSKWDNRISIVQGREYLFAYKMTPTTQVLNIATTCCHTFLLGRNPVYDANCVTTTTTLTFPVWSSSSTGSPMERLPFEASSRWFSNQWEPERLAKYPHLVGIWVREEDGSITGDPGWETVFAQQLECMQREIAENAPGETFDAIVDGSIGRDTIVIVSESPGQTSF